MLSTLGTETRFQLGLINKALSCPKGVASSFEAQVDCSARLAYDYWMRVFERDNKNGELGIPEVLDEASTIKTGKICMYADSLLYAMEWYEPLCHYKDHNEP